MSQEEIDQINLIKETEKQNRISALRQQIQELQSKLAELEQ